MRVLLVEDDPTLLQFLQILLHHSGLSAESIGEGGSALDAICGEEFAAIVLDLILPGMSGFEIIQKLQATHPHLLRRIIVLTGVAQSSLNNLPFSPLLWDVIRKPFDIDELTRSIRECSEFHSMPRLGLQENACTWLEKQSAKTAAKAGVVAALSSVGTLDLRAAFGYPPKVAEAFFPLSLSSPFPICASVRSQRPVWLASITRDSGDYPLLAPIWKASRSQAIAALPFIQNGRAMGAVAWSFTEPQRFDERQRDFFVRLASEFLPLVELRNARAS